MGCLTLLTIILLISVSSKQERVNKLKAEIEKVEAYNQIDSLKQVKFNKINYIIDLFNNTIEDSTRSLIINEIIESDLKYDNLSVDLICALITHESAKTWDPLVRSPVGAIGLCQVMSYTGSKFYETDNIVESLENPSINISIGMELFSYLISIYGIEGALIAYNAGEHNTIKWIRNQNDFSILPEETQKYVPYVLEWYDRIQQNRI